ncbi:MAG: hypothetical protein NC347_06400 [Clostridium sp.]|nr:hypothetical protein [Clostridium sp.]
MEKTIWVIGNNKKDMIEAQKKINSAGSMRAFCMLTFEALQKAVSGLSENVESHKNMPSLIILDYEMDSKEDFTFLSLLKSQQSLAGVPLFFMTEHRTDELDEECYARGATVVLRKPFSNPEVLRIERTAWQHEVTKNYEKMLRRQAGDLQAARKIHQLNEQLKSRNELLHQIFGRYFSEKVVDVILENPDRAVIGGEKREVTVMISDLRGFTSASENLDPDAVTDLLNFYFTEMLEVITKYHGIVIEFLGDGILAVFGAPLPSKRQSQDAVAAAICMQNSMKNVNCYCEEKGYPTLEMGIGIHQGEVFIGNVGSEKMMRYNVLGKTVNQCSRIESFSVGGQVLVSKETLDQMDCRVEVRNRIEVTAKGLSKPMPVYEVMEIGGEYNCSLNYVVSDTMYPADIPVTFNLYPIEGKRIMEYSISAQLENFSRRRATVLLDSGNVEELAEYTDVEIFAAGEGGRAVFTNVYAKIMVVEEDRLVLYFTHVNRIFQEFADKLLEEREEGIVQDSGAEKKTGQRKYRKGKDGMEAWKQQFEKIEDIQDMAGCGGVYRHLEEPLVVIEINKDLRDFVTSTDLEQLRIALNCQYMLFVADNQEEIRLFFTSATREIRALEFLDSMIPEFGLVKGAAECAEGQIASAILRVKMANVEISEVTQYFLMQTAEYFAGCDCIEAVEYSQNNRDEITKWQRYVKQKEGWAFVRSLDVAEKGCQIRIKTLENESGMILAAEEDAYIMIGCRGEVYDMKRQKFESTYEATGENLDVFEKMLDFIPAVENLATGEYISLDELAHICYPKQGAGIYAQKLTRRTKIFPAGENREYFYGRPGDYMAVRADDLSDSYIIQGDVFERTYEPAD